MSIGWSIVRAGQGWQKSCQVSMVGTGWPGEPVVNVRRGGWDVQVGLWTGLVRSCVDS